jgi:hypothetical protein
MRVIVIGGLGNFGARICRRLSLEDGFKVVATLGAGYRAYRGSVGMLCADWETVAGGGNVNK